MNPKESLMLNATSSISFTLFAKLICEDTNKDLPMALGAVDIFANGLKKGLEEHAKTMRVDTENNDIPPFIAQFFEKAGIDRNKEVDDAVEEVTEFVRAKLKQSIVTICAAEEFLKKRREAKGESPSRHKEETIQKDNDPLQTLLDETDDDLIQRLFKESGLLDVVNKKEKPKEDYGLGKPVVHNPYGEVQDTSVSKGQYDDLFKHHPPTPERLKKHEALRAQAIQFARVIEELVPSSRERTLTIRALQETLMWANAALAINEKE